MTSSPTLWQNVAETPLSSLGAHVFEDTHAAGEGELSLFPHSFLAELESFKHANAAAVTYTLTGHAQARCCPDCLKAYALQRARAQGFAQQQLHALEQSLPGAIGHDGYFINKGELVRAI